MFFIFFSVNFNVFRIKSLIIHRIIDCPHHLAFINFSDINRFNFILNENLDFSLLILQIQIWQALILLLINYVDEFMMMLLEMFTSQLFYLKQSE